MANVRYDGGSLDDKQRNSSIQIKIATDVLTIDHETQDVHSALIIHHIHAAKC